MVYTLMPIICDISLKKGIRPERPCAVASIASQVGITCSPIAAAVVAFVTISNANGFDITIPQVLMVSMPACLCGLMAAATCSYKRDWTWTRIPIFRNGWPTLPPANSCMATMPPPRQGDSSGSETGRLYLLAAIGVIVLFAIFQHLPPHSARFMPCHKGAAGITTSAGVTLTAEQLAKAHVVLAVSPNRKMVPLKMNLVIQIVMITAAALMIILCKASPKKAVSGAVWQSGMVAVIAIYGIAWLADTYFSNYMDVMKEGLAALWLLTTGP